MSKILITGGAGFIGSEFVRQTVYEDRFQVIVVDKLTYAGDLARLQSVKSKIRFYKADITNASQLSQIFKKERPAQVMHFAAETHVDRSIANAAQFIHTNASGTQNLLTLSHSAGIRKFIHVSTDEVYGEILRGRCKENAAFNPSSPYAASKAAADFLVKAYIRTFGFPAVIVRPCNNYGPWQYPEKLIPLAIARALAGQTVPIFAKGLNRREWLHVSDCARAIMAVLQKGKVGSVYNIGSGVERKNIDVVKTILNMLDRPKNLVRFVKDRPGHDFRYAIDAALIRKDLSWQPHIDFEQGLEATVRWYQHHSHWLNKKWHEQS